MSDADNRDKIVWEYIVEQSGELLLKLQENVVDDGFGAAYSHENLKIHQTEGLLILNILILGIMAQVSILAESVGATKEATFNELVSKQFGRLFAIDVLKMMRMEKK